jgi:hypothetical protein
MDWDWDSVLAMDSPVALARDSVLGWRGVLALALVLVLALILVLPLALALALQTPGFFLPLGRVSDGLVT